MRITVDTDADTTTVTVGAQPEQVPGTEAVNTGPASSTGETASETAGAVYVASPAIEGPPPFFPDPTVSSPAASFGDLSAGPAPGVADVSPGDADNRRSG